MEVGALQMGGAMLDGKIGDIRILNARMDAMQKDRPSQVPRIK